MKKRWSLIVLLVMALALFFSIGALQVYAADTIKLKFAHIFPGPAKQSQLCEAFVQELEERTNGRIKTQYFGGGSLLKPPGM